MVDFLSALRVKLPSMSVTVPNVPPTTLTEAPITGSPVSSTTLPFTTTCCAKALADRNKPAESVAVLRALGNLTCFFM